MYRVEKLIINECIKKKIFGTSKNKICLKCLSEMKLYR